MKSSFTSLIPALVTKLRDFISVPVPDIDVEVLSLRVPSLWSDESSTVELSVLPSGMSVMILVAPVALPVPENVIVVSESLWK